MIHNHINNDTDTNLTNKIRKSRDQMWYRQHPSITKLHQPWHPPHSSHQPWQPPHSSPHPSPKLISTTQPSKSITPTLAATTQPSPSFNPGTHHSLQMRASTRWRRKWGKASMKDRNFSSPRREIDHEYNIIFMV